MKLIDARGRFAVSPEAREAERTARQRLIDDLEAEQAKHKAALWKEKYKTSDLVHGKRKLEVIKIDKHDDTSLCLSCPHEMSSHTMDGDGTITCSECPRSSDQACMGAKHSPLSSEPRMLDAHVNQVRAELKMRAVRLCESVKGHKASPETFTHLEYMFKQLFNEMTMKYKVCQDLRHIRTHVSQGMSRDGDPMSINILFEDPSKSPRNETWLKALQA